MLIPKLIYKCGDNYGIDTNGMLFIVGQLDGMLRHVENEQDREILTAFLLSPVYCL